jgi:hypothetical protein
MRNVYRILVWKPEEKRPLGDLSTDMGIILKQTFKWTVRMWTGLMWLWIGSRMGPCKYGECVSTKHNKRHSTKTMTAFGRIAVKGHTPKHSLVCLCCNEMHYEYWKRNINFSNVLMQKYVNWIFVNKSHFIEKSILK